MAYLLSIGCTDSGKPAELVIGDYFWKEYKIIPIFESFAYDIKNVAITNSLYILGVQGDESRYTKYIISSRRILQKSITILAKGNNDEYFVSDGITDPKWASSGEIISKVNNSGYKLSNSVLEENELKPICGKFVTIER